MHEPTLRRHLAAVAMATSLVASLPIVWGCMAHAEPAPEAASPAPAQCPGGSPADVNGHCCLPGQTSSNGHCYVPTSLGAAPGLAAPVAAPSPGCTTDTQCKGDRVCERGQCVAPH